jgi:hypothetical protein
VNSIESTRAKIILLADEEHGVRKTANLLGIARSTVQLWRVQRLETDYLAFVAARLADLPRPGAPATYTPEQICTIVAMTCELPEDSDRPIVYFPQQEIADEALKRGIVDKISLSDVGRILTDSDLQPQNKRGWLTPSLNEKFEEKCHDVCETYKQAPEREKNGEKTISIDEMTGIQALERALDPIPMKPSRPERQEFESAQNGTQVLIAGFDVVFVPVFGEVSDTLPCDDWSKFWVIFLKIDMTLQNIIL